MIALLFDHLWQSTLFAGCVGLLTLAFRGNGAAARFGLWFAASFKFLVPFAVLTAVGAQLLGPLAPPLHAPALMGMAPVAQPFSGDDPVLIVSDAVTAPLVAHFDWAVVLLALWAAGFAVLVLRWLACWLRLRRLVGEAAVVKIAAPIAVKSSASRIEPGLVGIFRPVILMPQGIETKLSPAEMNTILAHELCHWRRRDNLLAMVHMLVEALFWFFPLVWWLGARLHAERERACDESVLAAGGDPSIYAEGILKVCRLYLQSPLACAAGVSGAGLKKRMEAIMENRFLVRLSGFKKGLLAFCAATAIAGPLSFGFLAAPSDALTLAVASPHPGTEAALRRQIEGWENKQPPFDTMGSAMAAAARRQTPQQVATFLAMVDGWGPLKSITFKENGPGGSDVYRVEFAHGAYIWTVPPLLGGKIQNAGFQPAATRTDNSPSPGVEAALRRYYGGWLNHAPAYDTMAPGLSAADHRQQAALERSAQSLGALKTLSFTRVNAAGWDVYAATFDKGSATFLAHPLVRGKLNRMQWADMRAPDMPAHPGTEASLRRYILSLEKGRPNYEEMMPASAASVRATLPDLLAMVRQWGALKSITFEGGGAAGMDVYEVTFEHGKAEWNIAPLSADGKVVMRNFRLLF